MTAVQLGQSAYFRKDARTPQVLMRNFYVEKDPTNLVDGTVHIQRPGLTKFGFVGDGYIRGIIKQEGTFNSDFLVCGGDNLTRVTEAGNKTVLSTTISGNDRVSMAASATRALVATGGTLYSTNGTTVTTVNTPDNIPIQAVAYINGYFLLTQANAQRMYWIEPGQTDPDPLSFFAAENSPDPLETLAKIGDEMWAFGGSSIEVFIATGIADSPFRRVEGQLYDKGCINRDTVVAKVDNTIFWVGSDRIVYRAAQQPTRISDFGIEERLRKADPTTLRAWAFTYNGHVFYVLTIPQQGTFAFDVASQNWVEFTSYGRDHWQCHVGAQTDSKLIVAGDDTGNSLWQIDPLATDDGGLPLIAELVGGVPIVGPPQPCRNFLLNASVGTADAGDNPVIQMRFSDDGGHNFTRWFDMPLGKRGEYRTECAVRRLGMMRAPGRIFHLRSSGNPACRISYARVNEAFAA